MLMLPTARARLAAGRSGQRGAAAGVAVDVIATAGVATAGPATGAAPAQTSMMRSGRNGPGACRRRLCRDPWRALHHCQLPRNGRGQPAAAAAAGVATALTANVPTPHRCSQAPPAAGQWRSQESAGVVALEAAAAAAATGASGSRSGVRARPSGGCGSACRKRRSTTHTSCHTCRHHQCTTDQSGRGGRRPRPTAVAACKARAAAFSASRSSLRAISSGGAACPAGSSGRRARSSRQGYSSKTATQTRSIPLMRSCRSSARAAGRAPPVPAPPAAGRPHRWRQPHKPRLRRRCRAGANAPTGCSGRPLPKGQLNSWQRRDWRCQTVHRCRRCRRCAGRSAGGTAAAAPAVFLCSSSACRPPAAPGALRPAACETYQQVRARL